MSVLVNLIGNAARVFASSRRNTSGHLVFDVNIDDATLAGNLEACPGQYNKAHPARCSELDAVKDGCGAVIVDDHRGAGFDA